jgi:outer membrane protein OmpA-like peptidoglycan-associated protein
VRQGISLRHAATLGLGMACLVALQGCGTAPAKPAVAAPAAPAVPRAPPPSQRASSLAVERQWLQSWFAGTPVRIQARGDDAFSIEVPRDFCFDTGRSEVKPPLAAVLDKLAQSLQRKPTARVEVLAAPGDADGASALALQRAGNVRKHLVSRGASPEQLGPPSAATLGAVQLRIGLVAH